MNDQNNSLDNINSNLGVNSNPVTNELVPPVNQMMQDPVPPVNQMMQEPVPPVNQMVQDPVPPVNQMMQEPIPAVNQMVQEPIPAVNQMVQEPIPAVNQMVQDPVPAVNQTVQDSVPAVNQMMQEPVPVPQPAIKTSSTFESELNQNIPYPQPVVDAVMKNTEPNLNTEMPNSIVNQFVNKVENKKMGNKGSKNKLIFLAIGVVAIVAAIILFIIAFGNNNKKLTCNMSMGDEGINMTTNLVAHFKGDEVNQVNLDLIFDLGEFVDYKDQMIDELQKEYSSEEFSKMNVKISSDDSKIYIKMHASQEDFKYSGLSTEGNYKETKSAIEKQGFVCK